MARGGEKRSGKTSQVAQLTPNEPPQSLAYCANLMSSVMSDLIEGRLAPNVGNAISNADGKLLRGNTTVTPKPASQLLCR